MTDLDLPALFIGLSLFYAFTLYLFFKHTHRRRRW